MVLRPRECHIGVVPGGGPCGMLPAAWFVCSVRCLRVLVARFGCSCMYCSASSNHPEMGPGCIFASFVCILPGRLS